MPETNKKDGKKSNALFGVSAIVAAILIVIVIFGVVFYLVIHNNFNGLGEKYRNQIQAIPLLKHALPKLNDSFNQEYMSADELKKKYNELLKIKDDMEGQIEESKNEIDELIKIKEQGIKLSNENESLKEKIEKLMREISEERKQTQLERERIAELEQKNINEDFKSLINIYENMDPAAAAKILEEMGDSKLDKITDIIKNLKKDTAAEILATINPKLASAVTEKLHKPE